MQNRDDLHPVGGSLVEWLVIAVVASMGVLAVADPSMIEVLLTAEL
jgi:Tfp pilus assembly protein PilV